MILRHRRQPLRDVPSCTHHGLSIALLSFASLVACSGEQTGTSDSSTSTSTSDGAGASGGAGEGGRGDGGDGGAGAGPIQGDFCSTCGAIVTTGRIANNDLDEASGLAASAIHPNAFYTHQDAGNPAEVFIVGVNGSNLGVITLEGAASVDYEDIACAPCSSGSCVFVGDIGDNDTARATYTIYRFPEPAAIGPNQTIAVDAFPFTYPDGTHNAETLLVHPVTGLITVVTKVSSGPSSVYEITLPGTPGTASTAVKVGTITQRAGSPRFTGGSVHPEARGVLLRTSTHAFFYAMDPGERVAEALQRTPCIAPVADEDQGEAIAWTADGRGYVTVGEGKREYLHAVTCSAP
ncbi:hypothetical protein [Chondromyces crocatus]|uniref:Lipoprotein n=1 Tax=Chondromyces crocatus TaxID=52 RepID=A0A0K1EMM1_CHOCO|nr:hypothetical protein [Chondromyces crocatus]AKT42104.1 uncharacterized protein CMC5_063280 [Chondromyces crocatus]